MYSVVCLDVKYIRCAEFFICSGSIRNIFSYQIYFSVNILSCSGNIRNIFRCQIISYVNICSCFGNI